MTRLTLIGGLAAGILLLSACQKTAETPRAGLETATLPIALSPAAVESGLPRPQYQVGDRWTYSDGYGMTVTEARGDWARFTRLDDSKQYFINRGIFREEAQSKSGLRKTVFQSDSPERLYGARPGESVVFIREYTKDSILIRHNTSWVIEGRETITVPAGTFNAIVLTKRVRSLTGSWTGFERWWYAPAARNYVRMEFKYGDAPESARVLVNYQLGSQS